jgi:PHP family Zn ribbon phosphoesterase
MFCFKCGQQLIRHGESLYCAHGDMYVSQAMESALNEIMSATDDNTTEPIIGKTSSLNCVRCSTRLVELNQLGTEHRCPQCGLQIGRSVIRQIIELHPHR